MEKFTIEKNDFLKQDIQGYFHTIYHSMYYNNTDTLHINKLKNDTLSFSIEELRDAGAKLLQNLNDDIPIILNEHNQNFTICIIPRAKIESIYQKTQLLFKEVINTFVRNFNQSQKIFSLENGTNYIIRIKNTKTTHLRNIIGSYENTGDKPYVGISKDTCSFSPYY